MLRKLVSIVTSGMIIASAAVAVAFSLVPDPVAAACSPLPTDKGQATFSVNVPSAATYRVWSRLYSPQFGRNGFYMQVDQAYCGIVVGGNDAAIPVGTFSWVNYQNSNTSSLISMSLAAGTHTVTLAGLDPGVGVDRVMFLSDLACVPSGTGDNCAGATATPVSTPVPGTPASVASLAITGASNGAKVSGSLPVQAIPASAGSISKVEFFIDGVSVRADQTSPYCLAGDGVSCQGWNSRSVANGNHVIKAVMTHGGGTTQASITVNVSNASAAGDTTAPSAPAGVTAVALNSAQVRLTWNPSTDNAGGSGVNGYRVYRNGATVPLAVAGAATTYVDSTTSAATTYTYTVTALDGANNESAKSVVASVKTMVATDILAPTEPIRLRAGSITANSLNLEWEASTDDTAVLGYHVYRNNVMVATVESASYTDSGLIPSAVYQYKAVAYDASANTSIESLVLTVKTMALLVVGNPTPKEPISGSVALKPSVTGPISNVDYSVDNKAIAGATLDTTKLKDGWHTIKAKVQFVDGTTTTVSTKFKTANHGGAWQKFVNGLIGNLWGLIAIGAAGLALVALTTFIVWRKFMGPTMGARALMPNFTSPSSMAPPAPIVYPSAGSKPTPTASATPNFPSTDAASNQEGQS